MSKYFEETSEDREAIERYREFCTGESLAFILRKPAAQLLQVIVEGVNGRSKEYVDSIHTSTNIGVLERRGFIRAMQKVKKENVDSITYAVTKLGLLALALAEAAQLISPRGAEVKSIGSRKQRAA